MRCETFNCSSFSSRTVKIIRRYIGWRISCWWWKSEYFWNFHRGSEHTQEGETKEWCSDLYISELLYFGCDCSLWWSVQCWADGGDHCNYAAGRGHHQWSPIWVTPHPPCPSPASPHPCAPYTALLATIIVSASFLYEILSHFDYFDVRKGAIYVFSLKTLENTNIFWYAKTFLPPCM